MRERGLKPDVISCSAGIRACKKGGGWGRALELLEEMREDGLMPHVTSCNAAISVCEKGGKWERALNVLEEMREASSSRISSAAAPLSARARRALSGSALLSCWGK
jgi:pentatricopeptide repeat domain-containing protein 1